MLVPFSCLTIFNFRSSVEKCSETLLWVGWNCLKTKKTRACKLVHEWLKSFLTCCIRFCRGDTKPPAIYFIVFHRKLPAVWLKQQIHIRDFTKMYEIFVIFGNNKSRLWMQHLNTWADTAHRRLRDRIPRKHDWYSGKGMKIFCFTKCLS